MEFIDMEAVDGKINRTKGIALVNIPKGKKPVLEEKAWLPPLEDGMEVEPNIAMLEVIEGMEIIPPPCTDI